MRMGQGVRKSPRTRRRQCRQQAATQGPEFLEGRKAPKQSSGFGLHSGALPGQERNHSSSGVIHSFTHIRMRSVVQQAIDC